MSRYERVLDPVAAAAKRTGLYALALVFLVVGVPLFMLFSLCFVLVAICYVGVKEAFA